MASRPKTRTRLQGALASRKDKRTSYPLPATHQEAPRKRFWGLFLAFRYKPGHLHRSTPLERLSGLPEDLSFSNCLADVLICCASAANAPSSLRTLFTSRLMTLSAARASFSTHRATFCRTARAAGQKAFLLPILGPRNPADYLRFRSLFLSIKTIYMPFLARKSAFPVRRGQGKGRWSRASIDPCSSLVYSIDRRVNSAIGERVGLDPLRGTRRPVVTDSSIDPPTRYHPKINAPRRAAAARVVGHGSTLPAAALLPTFPATGSR